jgi:hypothetical protein
VSLAELGGLVEVEVRDGGWVVWVRTAEESDDPTEKAVFNAPAPVGYVKIHGHGRGGQLRVGDRWVDPGNLAQVMKKQAVPVGSNFFLPICDIARGPGSFTQQFARAWGALAGAARPGAATPRGRARPLSWTRSPELRSPRRP